MTMYGWKTKFKEIRREFGYREKDDYLSAKKLNSLLKKKFSKKQLQDIITGKTVFIIGAGPSLSESLVYIKKCKNITKIVADGAVRALLEENMKPDILVTDLDGDLNSIKKIGRTKIPIIIHAHGDNYDRLEIVENSVDNVWALCLKRKPTGFSVRKPLFAHLMCTSFFRFFPL